MRKMATSSVHYNKSKEYNSIYGTFNSLVILLHTGHKRLERNSGEWERQNG